MMNRRQLIKTLGVVSASSVLPLTGISKPLRKQDTNFKYCLNTSTISGNKPGIKSYIETASKAGYDGIEVWIRDVKAFLDAGNSARSLQKYINDHNLTVESAIGFATWMVDDETQRKAGFQQMEEDLFKAGERYQKLLDLGRKTGVMPQLEFWGASPVFYHLGQALMVAAVANDPDTRLLPDIYHLFRGGSGFEGLKMLNGNLIEVFHMNDYPSTIPRQEQADKDRVYPGDGVAPVKDVLTTLKQMGGTKVLSLELFNRDYWKQDELMVAKTGLRKMKEQVAAI